MNPEDMAALRREEQDLITELNTHNVSYYVRGVATITDFDYDAKMRRLREVELVLGNSRADSPTQRVGSDLTKGFAKVKHNAPMLSLENVFSAAETLSYFPEGCSECVTVEAKIDGLATHLDYVDGILTRAVTRGDGTTGDDVTENIRTIRGIPLSLPSKVNLQVRGEVYMRRSVFEELNKARAAAGEDLFANPRNAAAGSLKLRSSAEVAQRSLSFIAYWSDLPADFTQQEMTAELLRMGFPTLLTVPLKPIGENLAGEPGADDDTTTPMIFACTLGDETELASTIDNIRVQRDDIDLDTDGAVVKINSRALQREMGNKTKSPRWGCAYKFPPERKATELLDIEITIGRTGQVTPNARLAPVGLSGTTVENASLMNADELERIGNPGIGDIVWVEKSAEIIPRVVGVKERRSSEPWKFPGGCPHCGCSLERKASQSKKAESVHLYCPNLQCSERVFQRLKHATSKGALDWDGMGAAQVQHLVDVLGPSRHPAPVRLSDLFTADPAQLGLKPAALKKFLAERERVKTVPLWRKLTCLGIEDIGQTTSKELAARYGSLSALIDAAVDKPDEVKEITGDVAFGYLAEFLKSEIDDLELLESCGFKFEEAGQGSGPRPLAGKVLVITGTLQSGTRDEVSARIESAGGIVKGSVGKKTSYLVVGEQPGATKTEDAKKYGIPVIQEEELYSLIGIPMPQAELPDLDAV